MDSSDLALVAGQIREMMTRVVKLDTKEALPELSQKLGAVAAQLAPLKDILAAEPPPAAEVAETEDAKEPVPQTPPLEPGPVNMNAFAAEHSPPDEDTRALIVRLLSTSALAPEGPQVAEEDGSVWKVDWSEALPESVIRPPKPSQPEPGSKPIPKPELWDDLSEGR